ncbi:uncharacterized protein [Haliotis cracherodii]|uniref:uncharacterized protein n=1 Tax=Haliotis cracherodii TaxID=6455 RepID=UPI0039EA89D7
MCDIEYMNEEDLESNMTVNNTTETSRNMSVSVTGSQSQTTTGYTCPEPTTAVYDYQGAMKFTVAVVLVYGIGVIGVLGIYVRRRRNYSIERDTDMFVKGLQEHRDLLEKKRQLSAVQNLINSIHGNAWKYTPSSTAASTPVRTPDINPLTLSLKRCGDDARSLGSPSVPEGTPLLFTHRRPEFVRCISAFTIERQESIPETEEEDEESVTFTPGQTPRSLRSFGSILNDGVDEENLSVASKPAANDSSIDMKFNSVRYYKDNSSSEVSPLSESTNIDQHECFTPDSDAPASEEGVVSKTIPRINTHESIPAIPLQEV